MHQPTLKHFILKQQALDLFRSAIRASRSIPDVVAREETIVWIRAEFERKRHLQDVAAIEDALKAGRRDMKHYFPASR
ncbi:hypothetical protein HETIRDRAFT_306094 [Heterobasidion irregulare TC 32-1]|uniref:LYR motif-containing protein 2 n=1 Tax=Heterobasidion irregulare (strain TC 32-1) TaxID=747525 RepID=W4KNN8_HETIT|nr:uncharacterized protein HETIRDRAFT_306094 [Heterobasidion irregulare TC 32-1]ETW87427.1 hypothetical protein HETIRDRAFT_306094 [Heterobasidion irregulare TC 32-1]